MTLNNKEHTMNKLALKPLSLALIASFALAQATYAADQAHLREDVEVTPGRSITPADEQVLSSSASMVLHHIARARDDLKKKDGAQATQELTQAETLLNIIQSSVPTTVVKSQVWTADHKMKYENTEEVPASSVPIYANLDERADFDFVKLQNGAASGKAGLKQQAPATAKPSAKAAASPVPGKEAEASDAALYFEELDLPLNSTRHFVATAQTAVAKKHLDEADQALRAALDNVDYVSSYLPAPLLAAKINLARAETHYGTGQKEEAQADLGRAITQLTAASKQADTASQADIKQMLDEAHSLNKRMGEPGLKAQLGSLWRRAEAHADRAMAYSSFGWAKLRHHAPLRSALIEARRYLSYADIDANVAGDAGRAKHDLEQAKTWLDKAGDLSSKSAKDVSASVKDIRTAVDGLVSGQVKPEKSEMAHLQQQLAQADRKSVV
jgi:hypothetical protein